MSGLVEDVTTGGEGVWEAGEEPVDRAEVAQEEAAQVEAARELAEHNALAAVFDDVRAQSAQSALVEPTRWAAVGVVPEHLTVEEFEMVVYEYLEEERTARAEAEAAAAPVYRTATQAVGVPRMFRNEPLSDEDASAAEAADADEGDAVATSEAVEVAVGAASGEVVKAAERADTQSQNTPDEFAGLELPSGYRLVEMEGEYVLVPDEEAEPVELSINCESVVALVGAHSYYLYDRGIMTDTYAHWAFLAAEDNNVVTFVDCVREDSRVYPRPLAASNLGNPPFNMTQDAVAQTWDIVRESNTYPDIQQTVASNGDVYYFSTEYLSPTYAASLAEWDAVERKMHL